MIDAHMHFWRLDRGDYEWLTPQLGALYADHMPGQAHSMLLAAGVDGVVAVQAAESEAETHFLLDLARANDWIQGVVGWTNLGAADAPDRIGRLVAAGQGALKAFRPMLQDMPERAWIARPALDRAFEAMVAHDLAFDALVRIDQLDALYLRAERSPGLRIVIDHAAKPAIAAEGFGPWAEAIAPLAALPHVSCKLSGLLTEAGPLGPAALPDYAAFLLESFGPERLIWGSDWPVLRTSGDYAGWLDLARALVPHDAVFGANARAFYRLGQASPVLMLHEADNVAVALQDIPPGTALPGGRVAREWVPFGFKVAVAAVPQGAPVLKYGGPIGSATRDIAAGELVHLHNMRSDYTATHTRELKDGVP